MAAEWIEPIATGSRLTLALVFLYAGIAKLRRPAALERLLPTFPIARLVPSRILPPPRFARLIAYVEVVLAVSLMTGIYATPTVLMALAVLGVFTVALAMSLAEPKQAGCGCFGAASQDPIGPRHVVRNAGFLALGAVALLEAPVRMPAFSATDTALVWISVLAISCAFLARMVGRPALSAIRPGKRSSDAASSRGEGAMRPVWFSRAHDLPDSTAGPGKSDGIEPRKLPMQTSVDLHDLDELEARACRLVAESSLPQDDAAKVATEKVRHRREDLRPLERELLDIDTRLNERLEAELVRLAHPVDSVDLGVLRLVLRLWTILLRRRTMSGLHTRVAGLEKHPTCDGDVVGDELLWRYFDLVTSTQEEDPARRRVTAIRALGALARQSACIGERQGAWLASDLYWSFSELRDFLVLHHLGHLMPYVVQAAANPLLLFYDVEKYRGLMSPLGRWFTENREWLAQGATTGRIPMTWSGLWLYDRRTGHLLGFVPSGADTVEDSVQLEVFFESIVTPTNLGRRDCSFAEMIERGAGAFGYMCVGSLCGPAEDTGRRPMRGVGLFSRILSRGPRKDLSVEVIRQSACDGPDGSGPGGAADCRGADANANRSWSAKAVRCLAEQIVTPTERVLSCLGEATGLCAGPSDRLMKNLVDTTFGGIPLGDCQLQSSANSSEEQRWKDYMAKVQAAEQAYEDSVTAAVEVRKNDVQSANDAANQAYLTDYLAAGGSASTLNSLNPITADKLKLDIEAAYAKEKAATDKAADTEKAAKEQARADKAAADKKAEAEKKGAAKLCPPDIADCGDDSCSAITAAARATLECLSGTATQTEVRAATRQPLWTDPSPLDDPDAASWLRCLSTFDEVDEVHRQCWAVDCGPEYTTTLSLGNCTCTEKAVAPAGPEMMPGMCGQIDCGDGLPTVMNGHCGCAPPQMGPFGVVGPYTLAPPPLYLDVVAERYASGPLSYS